MAPEERRGKGSSMVATKKEVRRSGLVVQNDSCSGWVSVDSIGLFDAGGEASTSESAGPPSNEAWVPIPAQARVPGTCSWEPLRRGGEKERSSLRPERLPSPRQVSFPGAGFLQAVKEQPTIDRRLERWPLRKRRNRTSRGNRASRQGKGRLGGCSRGGSREALRMGVHALLHASWPSRVKPLAPAIGHGGPPWVLFPSGPGRRPPSFDSRSHGRSGEGLLRIPIA